MLGGGGGRREKEVMVYRKINFVSATLQELFVSHDATEATAPLTAP